VTGTGVFQLALYLAVLIVLAKPLGLYMARVYEGHAPGLGSPDERGRSRDPGGAARRAGASVGRRVTGPCPPRPLLAIREGPSVA
jgi:hypothetical protein